MKTLINTKSLLGLLCFSLTLCFSTANAGKLYKWVDANGKVSYQDQPPPKGSKILSEKDVKSTATIRNEKQYSQNKALPAVTIYTIDNCDVCERFITLMRKNRVPHIELPFKTDREAQSKILEATGSLRVPSVMIGDTVFQKEDTAELRKALTKAGYDVNPETPKPTAEKQQETTEELE